MTALELLEGKNQDIFIKEVLESEKTRSDEPFNHAVDFNTQLKNFRDCKPTEKGADALIKASRVFD